MSQRNTTVGIGLLGAGTVGGTLIRRLVEDHAAISAKTGLDLRVRRVAVRDPAKPRLFDIPAGLVTDDPLDVVRDDAVDLVVEVMGGRDPAGDLVLAAIEAGKPVVTANKELIAKAGPELFALAREGGAALRFEPSVGGGIPVISPLLRDLPANRVEAIRAIINGTTNYILTSMAQHGESFADALAEAQALGYAEPDPTNDVDGHDADLAHLDSSLTTHEVDLGRQ